MSSLEKALKKHVAETESGIVKRLPEPDRKTTSGAHKRVDESELRSAESREVAPSQSIEINMDDLRDQGRLAGPDRAPVIRDQLRRIKRKLLANASGPLAFPMGNLIAVSSALSGDGKSFIALNLALNMTADRDYTVLLIDADVAKQDLTRCLGLEDKAGLTDLLLNENLDVGELLIKTDIPGLQFLPSGSVTDNDSELFASKAMARLIREISERYEDRVVVFDTLPLLEASAAAVLTSLVGQVAFVIKSGETPQQAVLEALSYIDKEQPVSLILNQATSRSAWGMYGGYYYHGYNNEQGAPSFPPKG